MILDAMSNVVEAMTLWSDARIEAKEAEILAFLNNIGSTLAAADFALSVGLFMNCKSAFDKIAGYIAASPSATLESAIIDLDAAYRALPQCTTSAIVDKVMNLKPKFKASKLLEDSVQSVADTARANDSLRLAIFEVVGLMASLAAHGLPPTAQKAIEQWRIRGDESCLTNAIQLVVAAKKLQAMPTFSFERLGVDIGCDGGELHMKGNILLGSDPATAERTNIHMESIASLKAFIVSLPVIAFATKLVQDGASCLLHTFGELVELSAIVPLASNVSVSSLSALRTSFVVPQKLSFSMSALTKALAQADGDEIVLESLLARRIFADIVTVGDMKEFLVTIGLMSADCKVRTDILLPVTSLFTHIHHIAAGVAWISTTFAGTGASPCTSKHRLKPELESVLDMISSHLVAAESDLSTHEHIWPLLDIVDAKLKLPIAVCRSWLALVRKHFVDMCSIILGFLVKGAVQVSKLVKGHIPAYEHYLDDAKCNAKLIKAKLVGYASKDLLVSESVALFNILAEIGKFRRTNALEVHDGSDDIHSESICEAQAAFKASKKFMSIIATATALYGLSGPARTKEIEALLKKAADIPKSLKKELERALHGTGGDAEASGAVAAAQTVNTQS